VRFGKTHLFCRQRPHLICRLFAKLEAIQGGCDSLPTKSVTSSCSNGGSNSSNFFDIKMSKNI
jgi:hypothetical protein